MPKRGLGIDVLTAARQRIQAIVDVCPRIIVSCSGGKDSSVLLHLVMEEAIRLDRRVGVLFIDLEAQYRLTIAHVEAMYARYAPWIDPYWICLPLALRNAVSMYQPKWQCWDPDQRTLWVREPPAMAITDPDYFPWFRRNMEFEEFVVEFGEWYSQGEMTGCFVGIRADESLNRFRTLIAHKSRLRGWPWTTQITGKTYNAYPLYDWRTTDIWTYNGRFGQPYNRLYDRMHQAGLSIHQQRICQPYGDDQRKGLWLYHVIEPETWGRVVARVNSANSGALYARESGNILGRLKISKPAGHTWESFARLLIGSLPPKTAEHFANKIAVFLKWYADRGVQPIPDGPDPETTARFPRNGGPSWQRICKALLRYDYYCKGLSFSPQASGGTDRYRQLMQKRRESWGQVFWL